MKKGELYQFTVTHAAATETRTDRQKTRAIARVKKALQEAEGPAEAVLNFQNAEEQLDALMRWTKDENGKITEQKYPVKAPIEEVEK